MPSSLHWKKSYRSRKTRRNPEFRKKDRRIVQSDGTPVLAIFISEALLVARLAAGFLALAVVADLGIRRRLAALEFQEVVHGRRGDVAERFFCEERLMDDSGGKYVSFKMEFDR